MNAYELRDGSEARRFLAEGLWLQRAAPPAAARAGLTLRCLFEMAAAGNPVPPPGFVADLAHLLLDVSRRGALVAGRPVVPGWSAGAVRLYEDLVLGRLDTDGSIARAADALARYRGRDRERALAYIVDRVTRRSTVGGVLLNPAAPRSALDVPAEELLADAWDSLARDGVMPLLLEQYEALTTAIRDGGDALGPEDLFELEHGTALAAFGQRVALRQVLQVTSAFEAAAGVERPRTRDGARDVASHLPDEDVYPVGGFASISTRGSIESLLHSQLAYMEPDERPDLFDIKFVRDELLYYARDESQFYRGRRTFVMALFPDLDRARVKDTELPHQRIVLLLALLIAVVRRLIAWLNSEALRFEFLFIAPAGSEPLTNERALLETIFREPIAQGLVALEVVDEVEVAERLCLRAARSRCHGLTIDTTDRNLHVAGVDVLHLRLAGGPSILSHGELAGGDGEDAWDSWRLVQHAILSRWVGSE